MTPLRLLETFCSLTLQVALLVLVTGWLRADAVPR